MNPKKINNVVNLGDEERYSYFIRKVTEAEEVWGLYRDGWATLSGNEQKTVIPFWPEEELALLCCLDQWQAYTPRLITLNDFMDKWLSGMKRENKLANIFYVNGKHTSIVIDPDILLEDLNGELHTYL